MLWALCPKTFQNSHSFFPSHFRDKCIIPGITNHHAFHWQRSVFMTTVAFHTPVKCFIHALKLPTHPEWGRPPIRVLSSCLFLNMSRPWEEHILDCGQHAVSFPTSKGHELPTLHLCRVYVWTSSDFLQKNLTREKLNFIF